jgi:hypothetical protein
MNPINSGAVNALQSTPQPGTGEPSLISRLADKSADASALEAQMGATLDQIGKNGSPDRLSLMQLLGDSLQLDLLAAATAETLASLKKSSEQVLRQT